MTQRYCVVLGDVVNSRNIKERAQFEESLNLALDKINKNWQNKIRAPFIQLKGIDEIGGVLRTVRPIGQIRKVLSEQIHPHQIRIAAAVGEVESDPNITDVSEMDGMAFARADILLSELESEGLTFRLSGIEPSIDVVISDELCLLDMIRQRWSERKMEIIRKYEKYESQKEVSKELDISEQAVSKQLRDAEFSKVHHIENRLFEQLEKYPEINNEPNTS